MKMISRECEKCGAPLENDTFKCSHCGAWYEDNKGAGAAKDSQKKIVSILKLPQGLGEFGLSSSKFFVMTVTITLVLYTLGWFFEDPQYWLNETTMLIWVGMIPIWLFSAALLWRTILNTILYALVASLVVFLMHILVIWAIRGNLWDDHLGIAALVAGSWLAGWLLGRLAHGLIRWRNIRDQ